MELGGKVCTYLQGKTWVGTEGTFDIWEPALVPGEALALVWESEYRPLGVPAAEGQPGAQGDHPSKRHVVGPPTRVLLPLSQQVFEPHLQALRAVQSQPPGRV